MLLAFCLRLLDGECAEFTQRKERMSDSTRLETVANKAVKVIAVGSCHATRFARLIFGDEELMLFRKLPRMISIGGWI